MFKEKVVLLNDKFIKQKSKKIIKYNKKSNLKLKVKNYF